MRSDYGLYVVAIICFVIAIAFAGGAVQGYTLAEPQGITVTIVFLVLGIISGVVGYSARPKAVIRAPSISTPSPTPVPVVETPASEPMEEPKPEPTPPEPSVPLVTTPSATLEAEAPTSTPATIESPTEPVSEQQPEAVAEEPKIEEAPREKPIRRRRKKTQ
jgi:hypothetical protein